MKKNLLVLIAIFTFLCGFCSIETNAAGESWSDDGIRATSFSLDDTNQKLIEIGSSSELGLLAYKVNVEKNTFEGYTIRLMKDLDLSGYKWDPIGHYTERSITEATSLFKGTFEGNGHTVSNMNIQILSVNDANHAFGLFGGVLNGSVKNLSLTNAVVEIGNSEKSIYAGTVAGFFAGSQVSNITVTSASVKATGNNSVHAGGVSGCVFNSGTLTTSSLNNIFSSDITLSTITSDEKYRGGITGFANESYAKFNNCYAQNITFAESAAQNDADASGNILGCGNVAVLNYCYYDGETAIGINGPFPPELSNISKEMNGRLETPVTINNTTYEMLVSALNAWVENSGGSSDYQKWDCDTLGIEHDFEAVYLDGTYHQLKCRACTYSVNEKHKSGLENQKEATCTTEGYTGDEVCSICKEVLKAGQVTEKLAHNYVDGKCTVCGTADPDYKISEDSETTTEEYTKNIKNNDKNNKNAEKISAPRTGEESPVVFWIGILVASAVIAVGTSSYRKKQNKA